MICDGVGAAPAAGIINRDLKPDNLFITARDGHSFVKVLDFEISKFAPTSDSIRPLTREGQLVGTPYYMSPEQMDGDTTVDERTDVYALGVILYECAAGQKPFDSDNLAMLAVLIQEAAPEPLAKRYPDLPPSFGAAVERAMHVQRGERFANVRELAEAIRPSAVPLLSEGDPAPEPSVEPAAPPREDAVHQHAENALRLGHR